MKKHLYTITLAKEQHPYIIGNWKINESIRERRWEMVHIYLEKTKVNTISQIVYINVTLVTIEGRTTKKTRPKFNTQEKIHKNRKS